MENILKNPANKLIAVDMDGTLCEGKFWVSECEPKLDVIEKINALYKKGAHIIIWTARFPKEYEMTLEWLLKHKVLFHGIAMRVKIGADIYIDDKAISLDDFINTLK